MTFCSFGPHTNTYSHSTSAMQFKLTTLFALALAGCASASLLPRQLPSLCSSTPVCVLPAYDCCTGTCQTVQLPVGALPVGALPVGVQIGTVSMHYRNFCGVWNSFVALVPVLVSVIQYLSDLRRALSCLNNISFCELASCFYLAWFESSSAIQFFTRVGDLWYEEAKVGIVVWRLDVVFLNDMWFSFFLASTNVKWYRRFFCYRSFRTSPFTYIQILCRLFLLISHNTYPSCVLPWVSPAPLTFSCHYI